MKTLTAVLLFILASNTLAMAAKARPEGTVAICGDYALRQGDSGHSFAGIRHRENVYSLVSMVTEGESIWLEIELNSEGALLKGTEITEYDKNTGAVKKYLKHEIVAMWGNFYLVSKNELGVRTKVNCVK